MLKEIIISIIILISSLNIATASIGGEILHISFDENKGTYANDTSGHNHNAILQDGVTWVPGKYGYAVRTDGDETATLTIPADSELDLHGTDFTISLLVKPKTDFNALSNYSYFLFKKQMAYHTNGYHFGISKYGKPSKPVMFDFTNGSTKKTLNDNPEIWFSNVWASVAITYDHENKTAYFYRNTELIGTCQLDLLENSDDICYPNSQDIILFKNCDAEFDELYIFNRNLTPEEIKLVAYNNSIASNTTYYVSPEGDDNNSGTSIEDAFRTIEYAAFLAQSGDTIEVLNGTYNSDNITLNQNGTEDFPITFHRYNGSVILDGMNEKHYAFNIGRSQWIKIDGFEITRYSTGIEVLNSDNITITNFSCTNMTIDGMEFYKGCDNVNISHGVVHNTTSHGIHISDGNSNFHIQNVSLKDNRHNQIDFHTNFENGLVEDCDFSNTPGRNSSADIGDISVYLHNTNVNNITIRNNTFCYAPRPIEMYNAHNVTVINNQISKTYINSSDTSNSAKHVFLFGGVYDVDGAQVGAHGVFDCIIKDNTINDSGYTMTFYSIGNETSYSGSKHLYFQNITFLNNTYSNMKNSYIAGNSYSAVKGLYIIDEKIGYSDSNELPMRRYSFENTSKIELINTNIQERYNIMKSVEHTNNYYLDIIVVDEYRNPIPNAPIELIPSDSRFSSLDGWGLKKEEFYTQDNAKIALPSENRSECPVLTEYYINASDGVHENVSYTASVSIPSNEKISINVTPESFWYRKDPNIPTYTITAIIPEDSKDPHLTGFAPSAENPFNPGETKNFRVWTDESLTEMLWYVDGSDSPVSKGTLNYTWPITEGNHTIKFIGSNANGTVSQVWRLGETSDEPTQEIEFSPLDSILTKNISETVDFSVSPDVFTTKEWYIDGKLIQNNTVSMSKNWCTAGTYNVTFSGSTSKEPVLHTWNVNVIEEPKEQNKTIVTIAPEYQIVEPKKPFNLSIKTESGTPITGTQLDFIFNSSMTSVINVTEGDLFKQSGAYTIFSSGTINNSAGTVKNIYGFILGTSNVSSPGTMATVNLTAGNKTGMAGFSLSNVLISDANSKSVPYNITNATVLIDTAPIMSTICCPKSVNEKTTLSFKVSAKDTDGDRLVLSASGLPQGAIFNTTSGNFTWTPSVGQAGVYTLTFKVSDGYLTDSENVTVTVNRLNNPPIISSFEPLNGSSFSEGERIGISVNASDADGQALNYSIRIDGAVRTTDTKYVWETDYSSSGNHTIEVAVSDGIDEVKAQSTVFINDCHPRWDVNEDGVVNILDITRVSQTYGTTVNKPYPRHDVNQDGVVNILDLTLVGNHFGEYVK